jgi:hypothetical protein
MKGAEAHRLQHHVAGRLLPWRHNTTIVRRADAHQRLAELKRQTGGDILVFGSHTLWTTCSPTGWSTSST